MKHESRDVENWIPLPDPSPDKEGELVEVSHLSIGKIWMAERSNGLSRNWADGTVKTIEAKTSVYKSTILPVISYASEIKPDTATTQRKRQTIEVTITEGTRKDTVR